MQFHAEVNEVDDWVFSACTCPISRMCKHGAAVALRLRGPERAPSLSPWQERLARISGELERRAASTLAGSPLGLEVSRRPASRWSRGTPGDFTMRPVRPGARRGWARSGAEWSDLAGPATSTRYVPAQVEALQALRRGLAGGHTYLVTGAAPMLDDYGDRLVPALRAALAAGVTLVPGAGVASVSVSSAPARVAADLTRRDDGSALEVFAEVDERRWRGDRVTPGGRPATSLALVDGDDVLLTDLDEPLADGLVELLLGAPVVAPDTDLDPFLDALAPLARHVAISSSDGSLEAPAPPRPRLLVTVTWHSSTHAGLGWRWAYGEATCEPGAADSLAGARDPEAEQAIWATVPAHLAGRPSVTGGDALSLALHDLPHLATLSDVTVVEVEPPDFRESTSAPEVAFTLAEAQPDHTDWLDLEVLVSVEGEQVPLPDVLAAVTRGDEFLVLPSGLYVSLDRPEFARLHEVVAAASELRERDGPGSASAPPT